MSRVKNKNTKPELVVRSLLHRLGFRFRLHRKDLPGTPDLILPKYRIAVFVHGCFWHGHNCKKGKAPETNRQFWIDKINVNRDRDTVSSEQLEELGWKVITIWECQTKSILKLSELTDFFLDLK